MTLGFGLLGMDESGLTREGLFENRDKLGGEGDFGYKQDDRTIFGESLGGESEIDVGFAGASDAMEKFGRARSGGEVGKSAALRSVQGDTIEQRVSSSILPTLGQPAVAGVLAATRRNCVSRQDATADSLLTQFFTSALLSDAGGEEEVGDGGERGEVIIAEPGGGREKMVGKRSVVEELGDGFDGEIDLLNGGFAENNARGGGATEGN